ncbi:hypothetical protein [Bradyrhizobium sp. CCBAU 11357]|uniref:hypothetical protein n=1 Tax=Bradyrhizobium sp. CCBAU 11357 TaxID=1630808 RepID=UPI0023046DD9|nr:hypothetical protein [Bradyrhizobium sp. CCBAU 11357]MDA9498167.1 hypothetical protein [Bradyrhizobium sp. CCBAU 11357]
MIRLALISSQRALAEDPAGVFGDISTVLTGGETVLAGLPGLAGKAAKVAGTAGRIVDPLNVVTKPLAAGAAGGIPFFG